MKIIYKTGDLMTCPEKVIIHGCNAQGVMGSGVAKCIRETYPDAYAAYMIAHSNFGLQLGRIYPARCGDKIILNAVTQDHFGKTGARFVSYDAIVKVFEGVQALKFDDFIAMPKIGSHLGGGDWNIIEAIIENTLTTIQPVVYVL